MEEKERCVLGEGGRGERKRGKEEEKGVAILVFPVVVCGGKRCAMLISYIHIVVFMFISY